MYSVSAAGEQHMMSDESLTARNRINQRNFRARRQNYIKELEERIRKYESDGVQATIEIQAAARQVTDQNIKLRNLLVQRFGMSDYEISNHLGFHQQSPLQQNQPFPSMFGTNPQLPNPSPAPSGGLAPKPSIPMEISHSYPTPPQQIDPPRTLTSAQLDPALSLASLHKYPASNHDAMASYSEHPPSSTSRHNSEHSLQQQHTDTKYSHYDTRRPSSPTDTLSESSNPATPAEQQQQQQQQQHHQMQLDHNSNTRPTPTPATTNPQQPNLTQCCQPSKDHNNPAPRPIDETSCEEAARIIASMRGSTGNADQVMLELGCGTADARCQVKNLNIFQLLDRG